MLYKLLSSERYKFEADVSSLGAECFWRPLHTLSHSSLPSHLSFSVGSFSHVSSPSMVLGLVLGLPAEADPRRVHFHYLVFPIITENAAKDCNVVFCLWFPVIGYL